MHNPSRLALAGAIAALLATPAHADLNDGLVAHYTFSGSADDISGHGNFGAVSGAQLTTGRAGDANGAYAFSGVGESIEVADSDSLDITGAITLSAWINPAEQRTQYLLVKGTNVNGDEAAPYGLSTSATGDVIFAIRPDGALSQTRSTGYDLNEWNHVVGTYDGATATLYVNGVLAASRQVSGALSATTLPLLIGTRLGLASDTVNGTLDDLRIYNRALSADEVAQLHDLGGATPCAATAADVDAAYEQGRLACLENPASCGIDTGNGGNVSLALTLVETARQEQTAACAADPASCGISVGGGDSASQQQVEEAVTAAVAACAADPASCGIEQSPADGGTEDPAACALQFGSTLAVNRGGPNLTATLHLPYVALEGSEFHYWVDLEAQPFDVGNLHFRVTDFGYYQPPQESTPAE
ncbi:LamG domain-containing protein [Endothiovibrio diazotrophicus]